jgi:hypothetical protein
MKLVDITTENLNTLVGLLTVEQKESLVGVKYTDDSYYNPIQDINDNWVISTEEMIYTTNPDTMWVKDLDLIDYIAKPEAPELN